MDLPPCLQPFDHGVLLRLSVQPRASRTGVAGFIGDELRLRVTAPPVDAAANTMVIQFLANTLGCPKGAIRIHRGAKSRHKIIRIDGLGVTEVARRIVGLTSR